jgi:hypothetical protein
METRVDNPAPMETSGTTATPAGTSIASPTETAFSWKGNLAPDFANSPTMQKFSDDKAGFNEAIKSHLSLEQMLGHEKVPVPKGDFKQDPEGWARFSKAMGVPDKAEAYGLPDAEIPKEMAGLQFNKQEFAEIAHGLKLTPGQTKELWNVYTGKTKEQYANHLKAYQEQMTQVVNQMRSEWGDAYDTNVELGQMVINKFAADQETQDWVTSRLVNDPRGIKFLARLGEQFAENKIGEFGYKNFSLTPDQAQTQIDEILKDPKHPYNDERANPGERERAIDLVNGLYAAIEKAQRG